MTSMPALQPAFTTARITAFKPGASPPPVSTPILRCSGAMSRPSITAPARRPRYVVPRRGWRKPSAWRQSCVCSTGAAGCTRAFAGVNLRSWGWHQLGSTVCGPPARGIHDCQLSRALLAALVIAATPLRAGAQPAAPVLQAQVSGQTVTATWTAVPGATSYRAEAGVTPGLMLAGYELGPADELLDQRAAGHLLPARARPKRPGHERPVERSRRARLFDAGPAGAAHRPQRDRRPARPSTFSVGLPPGPLTGMLFAAGLAPGQTAGVVPMPLASRRRCRTCRPAPTYARMHAVGPGGHERRLERGARSWSLAGGCHAPTLPASRRR